MGEPRKRRKKKSKFGYYLYAVVVLLLTIANISLAVLLLTHVQNVDVSGVSVVEEEAVREWVTEDPKTVNSLYTWLKYKTGKYELPVYLQDVKVSLSKPWEVKVHVTEKEIVACVKYKDSFVYIDKDGLVMDIQKTQKEGVSLVEGVSVQGAKKLETLKVKEEKLFGYMEEISHELKRTELKPDCVVWENDSMNLYFGEVCVELGKMNYDVKIQELPPILTELSGKSGVINMQHYSETSDSITFVADEEPVVEEETMDEEQVTAEE